MSKTKAGSMASVIDVFDGRMPTAYRNPATSQLTMAMVSDSNARFQSLCCRGERSGFFAFTWLLRGMT